MTTTTHPDMTLDAAGFPIEACSRCGGTGRYTFDGSTNICYLCRGSKPWHRFACSPGATAEQAQAEFAKVLDRRAKDRARRAAANNRKAAKKVAEREAKRAALAELFNDYPAAVDATYYENLYAADAPMFQIRGYGYVGDRYWEGREISPRMLQIAAETTDRIVAAATAAATTPPITAGRQVVTGEVVSTKLVESFQGYREVLTYKMVVRTDAGQRIYSTIPNALFDVEPRPTLDTMKGRRVQFTATVEASADDPGFGFAARPTKAVWV